MTDRGVPRPGKILVMDDEHLVLATARLMLRRLGYVPVLVENIDQAVAAYAEGLAAGDPVHVAILDLVIKGSEGAPEAAARLLELDPQARLVVASGSPSHPVMENYADHGFLDRIVKPFALADLGGLLGSLID